jgi:hypothetical protein
MAGVKANGRGGSGGWAFATVRDAVPGLGLPDRRSSFVH